jgi:hypothetical protein
MRYTIFDIGVRGVIATLKTSGSRALIAVVALMLAPLSASAGQLTLAWDPSPDTNVTYTVYYGTSPGSYTQSVETTQTMHTVQGLSNGVRYYFVVRASAGGVLSAPTNEISGLVTGSATPVAFTDDPLVPGVHMMRAVHIDELRARINALRTSNLLSPVTWSDSVSANVAFIKASHIAELRSALNEVYGRVKMPLPEYADAPLAAGMSIKAVHITQLRAAVQALE